MDFKADSLWHVVDLGLVPYREAWKLQLQLIEARDSGRLEKNIMLIVEHLPVFTLGKRGGRENLLVSEERLAESGISVVQVERGGNITYHGPGQLVVYPIVHLPRLGIGVVDMVDRLEDVMIRICGAWGISAQRNPLNRGVWVGLNKIGAIGIAVRKGISFHGMALNVNTDLGPFCWIQPCGLTGVGVTSLQVETGKKISMPEVHRTLEEHVQDVFSVQLMPVAPSELTACMDLSASPAVFT